MPSRSNVGDYVPKSRVLHLSTVHQPYDVRIFLKEVRTLADAGYDVSAAMTVKLPTRRDGITIVPLGEHDGSKWRRIIRNIRAIPLFFGSYDVVHIHDPELLILGGLAAFCGRKVIYDIHEFYRTKFSSSEMNARWLGPLRPLVARLYPWLENLLLPHFAGVVVVTPEMRELYTGIVSEDRLALVRNFPAISEEDILNARASASPLHRPYVVHTGGAARARAFHVLVEVAERLGNDITVVNLGPIHLGEYSPAQRAELLARAEKAGVIMPGRVSYNEMLRWLAHASVGYALFLPSSGNNVKGLATKVFEYFAFGLPVVVSDVGATAEIVRRHNAGMVVDPEDADAHVQALRAMITNTEKGRAAAFRSEAIAPLYTFAAEARSLLALYQRVVSCA